VVLKIAEQFISLKFKFLDMYTELGTSGTEWAYESGVLPEATEGAQQSAGNLTAALPRRPVTCDEGQSHYWNFLSCVFS